MKDRDVGVVMLVLGFLGLATGVEYSGWLLFVGILVSLN